MKFIKKINLDLGIKKLIPEWKDLFTTKYLSNDISAGVTVACIAIPLSLAIALASGVLPEIGLMTAVIAGIVCAFFGGTPLSISGPAAAMAVLLSNNVERYGFKGLIFMCLLAGVTQLMSGVLRFGRIARYVPLPVISGFTAGIGVIIILGQLPRIFGLEPPPQSHIWDVISHFYKYFNQINYQVFILVVFTFVIIRGLPKLLPRSPAPLIAIILVTAVVFLFHMDKVPLIGQMPNKLPAPSWPQMPAMKEFWNLLTSAFFIYVLASLETLLSSTAVDKLSKGKRHDPDQELIGQGLGNIAVSFFGGMPVTGVIARSALNVIAGAKTRRSSIFHSIIILVSIYTIAPLISRIPIAALAGVLFSVALNMINYKELRDLTRTSHAEAFIYLVTFVTIVLVDLVAGIQIGMAAAAFIVLIKAARAHLHTTFTKEDVIVRLSVTGTLTFLSTVKITELEQDLENLAPGQIVIMDLSKITELDSSGTAAIIELFHYCQQKGLVFYLKGLPRRFELMFIIYGGSEILEKYHLVTETELRDKVKALQSFHSRLIHGVKQYHKTREISNSRLADFIAEKQDPHTLFITCSDSRIIPSIMTSSDPGELFIVRNVGNYIPAFDMAHSYSEGAAIEFALNYLNITDIVICGHANCGAMKACSEIEEINLPQKLGYWIKLLYSQLKIERIDSLNKLAQKNVLQQVENLKTYPIVMEKLAQGKLKIHPWFFDVEKSLVYEWFPEQAEFKLLGDPKVEHPSFS